MKANPSCSAKKQDSANDSNFDVMAAAECVA